MGSEKSYTGISFVQYPRFLAWMGILSMATFRIPLWMNKKLSFFKLMGCGKGDSFDFHPDWRQWIIISVHRDPDLLMKAIDPKSLYGVFIAGWIKMCRCEVRTLILEPLHARGNWDGSNPFATSEELSDFSGKIAILTRATIRIKRIRNFWRYASLFNKHMSSTSGLLFSIGMGEIPFFKQATFSIWENMNAMKAFAYQSEKHQQVIQQTRKEEWYSEEMFVRFRIVLDTIKYMV